MGWFAAYAGTWVTSAGMRLPQGSVVVSDYIAGVVVMVGPGLLIPLLPACDRDDILLLLSWIIKCFVVLGANVTL